MGHEWRQLLGDADTSRVRPWADRARALAERGVGRAIVTLGGEGSEVLAARAGAEPVVTPIPAVRVTPRSTARP